jgi:hypothetical protein
LEWTIPSLAKPDMAVFEGWEESERRDGKLGSLQRIFMTIVEIAD